MAENQDNLTTYEIFFFNRATGMAIKDERYDDYRHTSETPPTAPTGDEVAILCIQGVTKGQDTFWGFDGKWHKDQPKKWDLLEEPLTLSSTAVTDDPGNVLQWPASA